MSTLCSAPGPPIYPGTKDVFEYFKSGTNIDLGQTVASPASPAVLSLSQYTKRSWAMCNPKPPRSLSRPPSQLQAYRHLPSPRSSWPCRSERPLWPAYLVSRPRSLLPAPGRYSRVMCAGCEPRRCLRSLSEFCASLVGLASPLLAEK